LKNNELIEWLESTKHGRGLIDDKPCYINANATNSTSLPLPNDELSDSAKIPGSTTRSDSEVNEVDFDIPQIQDFSGEIDTTLLEIAKKLRKEGFTKTAAIKLIFGIDGGSKFSQISKFLN
jgi:hypothetical protein